MIQRIPPRRRPRRVSKPIPLITRTELWSVCKCLGSVILWGVGIWLFLVVTVCAFGMPQK